MADRSIFHPGFCCQSLLLCLFIRLFLDHEEPDAQLFLMIKVIRVIQLLLVFLVIQLFVVIPPFLVILAFLVTLVFQLFLVTLVIQLFLVVPGGPGVLVR